jgi:SAM-dependent methyltransferase
METLLNSIKNNQHASSAFPGQFSDWDLYGSPLRPCPQDIEFLTQYVMRWRKTHQAQSVKSILLGVTPEIAQAFSREHDELIAIDLSQKMIANTWPGNTENRKAIEGSWFDLPVQDNSVDIIFGDGILSIIDFPSSTIKLIKETRRVLKKDGALLLRCFCRPDKKESITEILSDLHANKIGSFHAFKWRIMMAFYAENPAHGIAVHKSWEWFQQEFSDERAFSINTGWPTQVIDTMRVYQNNPSIYTYPSIDEISAKIRPYFECVNVEYGDYELADRCPTITLKPLK